MKFWMTYYLSESLQGLFLTNYYYYVTVYFFRIGSVDAWCGKRIPVRRNNKEKRNGNGIDVYFDNRFCNCNFF